MFENRDETDLFSITLLLQLLNFVLVLSNSFVESSDNQFLCLMLSTVINKISSSFQIRNWKYSEELLKNRRKV